MKPPWASFRIIVGGSQSWSIPGDCPPSWTTSLAEPAHFPPPPGADVLGYSEYSKAIEDRKEQIHLATLTAQEGFGQPRAVAPFSRRPVYSYGVSLT